jgi:hemerythrin-like domain-containing protein
MQATKILMDEHLVIQRVLTALESATERIGQGEQMRAVFFLNVALFNKNFTDGCHHHKEEGVFFVAMEEAGIPTQGGPINVMLAEHEQGRLFTRELKYAAEFASPAHTKRGQDPLPYG